MTARTLLLVGCVALVPGCRRPESRVVVYCAQDPDYAEGVFAAFAANSGLTVAPKFDTEANKSVGLAVDLEAEAARPRADVHWNNEVLATIRLARKGVYEPYRSPSASGYPAGSAAADGTWQGFATRARVLIVNTDLVPPADRPKSLLDLTDAKWAGKVAMAKPAFGTTATQAACLFDVLGIDAAKAFYRGLKRNGVRVVAGNKQVAVEVAAGRAAVGLTDSDDAVIEVLAGKPVAVVAPDAGGRPAHPRLGTLFIPNTVAVVKNAPNPAGAQRLADELLKPETEAMLAAGGGYQLPLHPANKDAWPAALAVLKDARPMAADFEAAADQWDAAQAFLRDEFAR